MGKPQRVDIHIIKKTGIAQNVKGGTLHLVASAKEGRGNLIMDKSYKKLSPKIRVGNFAEWQ